MRKRTMSMVLAGAMCVSVLAGSTTGFAAENQSEVEESFEEHREITIWQQADDYTYYSTLDENPVTEFLNEKFNMTMKFQHPAKGSEQDQFNLMIGTGEYTDVMSMAYSLDSIESMFDQGVVQDLTPYESYMPNYINYLNQEGNEDIKALAYRDGKLLSLLGISDEPEIQWGGMVYRRDILETMTDGNVQFPSGNEEPTTVEDWEYMLELMKQYFEEAGMADYGCLILPASGYCGINGAPIVGGFGTSAGNYLVDGKVVFGPTTENFYNYLVKMKEWYEKGYIYKDFASRTQDPFYLPNTALTYGGAAGIWYGMGTQLGDALSMPEYGMEMDVRAVALPLDTEHGITGEDCSFVFDSGRAGQQTAFCVSTSCSEENLIRFMQAMDYLYTEEGSRVKTLGLTAEQAAGNEVYAQAGLAETGTYSINEDGTYCFDYGWDPGLENAGFATGARLPGILLKSVTQSVASEEGKEANVIWTQYGRDMVYPFTLTPSTEDSQRATAINTQMFDYINSMVPQFIMGTAELNEETFQAFVDQIKAYGVDEYVEIYQKLYDEFMAK